MEPKSLRLWLLAGTVTEIWEINAMAYKIQRTGLAVINREAEKRLPTEAGPLLPLP